MASPISRFAPTAVVVAAVSYCAWPFVFPPSSEAAKQTAAMPEIAPSQLSPLILPPPTRDPFRPVGELAEQATARKKTVLAQTNGRNGPKGAIAARGKSDAADDPLSGLALCATSILAGQRLAVINGRIYAEREPLNRKDPSAPPCIVARILPDRVLLECAGRTATLSYANVVTKVNKDGAASPASPPRPRPGHQPPH
jgi:hypothetical protein